MQITNAEQLQLWLKGESRHAGDGKTGQCCPDFSCCGGTLASLEERQKFCAHYDETGEADRALLGVFLGRMIAKQCPGKDIHIAGREEPTEDR